MSKKTAILSAKLERIERENAAASEDANNEWNRLAQKYNMPSFELDSFYQSVFRVGALSQQRIDTWSAQRELEMKKSFWKKLFRN